MTLFWSGEVRQQKSTLAKEETAQWLSWFTSLEVGHRLYKHRRALSPGKAPSKVEQRDMDTSASENVPCTARG